jgi:hypothetical protein
MNPDRLIGSAGIRFATLILALLCLAAMALDFLSQAGVVLRTLTFGCAILTFMGIVYSFRAVYSLWMRVAKALHAVGVTLLFGACYLFIIPLFFLISWAFDPLRLRNRSEPQTFWIPRRRTPCDLTFLQRMV